METCIVQFKHHGEQRVMKTNVSNELVRRELYFKSFTFHTVDIFHICSFKLTGVAVFDTTAHVRRLDFMSEGRIGSQSGDEDMKYVRC